MALAPEDLPVGYFDDYGEWLVFIDVLGGLSAEDAWRPRPTWQPGRLAASHRLTHAPW